MDAPELLGPGEGESIGRIRIKAGRPELAMTESLYEPGKLGPDPHVHHHHVDAFYVLEGRLAVALGPAGDEREIGAGDFALVPPDVVHTFRNPGPEEAHFINWHAPGMGFDEYLRSGYQAQFDADDPPADGGRPPSEAIVRPAGAGESLALGPTGVSIKVGADDALGSLAVLESTIEPGFPGPVLHRHDAMVDSFYVLDGVLTVHVDGGSVEAGPGSYALVPPGNPHTFSSPGDAPVRILNVMAPAGLEQYMKELAALGRPPDPATMAEFASKYDFAAV